MYIASNQHNLMTHQLEKVHKQAAVNSKTKTMTQHYMLFDSHFQFPNEI